MTFIKCSENSTVIQLKKTITKFPSKYKLPQFHFFVFRLTQSQVGSVRLICRCLASHPFIGHKWITSLRLHPCVVQSILKMGCPASHQASCSPLLTLLHYQVTRDRNFASGCQGKKRVNVSHSCLLLWVTLCFVKDI